MFGFKKFACVHTLGSVIMSSLITRNGSVSTPKFAIHRVNEKLTSGIQFKYDATCPWLLK